MEALKIHCADNQKSADTCRGTSRKNDFVSDIGRLHYLLQEMGYSLQTNQKMNQVGEAHPDRNGAV